MIKVLSQALRWPAAQLGADGRVRCTCPACNEVEQIARTAIGMPAGIPSASSAACLTGRRSGSPPWPLRRGHMTSTPRSSPMSGGRTGPGDQPVPSSTAGPGPTARVRPGTASRSGCVTRRRPAPSGRDCAAGARPLVCRRQLRGWRQAPGYRTPGDHRASGRCAMTGVPADHSGTGTEVLIVHGPRPNCRPPRPAGSLIVRISQEPQAAEPERTGDRHEQVTSFQPASRARLHRKPGRAGAISRG